VIEFKLPALGENIEQGDLVRLMIAPGASVSEGQTVMELETDKAVVEVPSSVSGVVKEVKVKEGDKERIQIFQGIVISRKGGGTRQMFTVRKVSGGVGVERMFPLNSPSIDRIEVERHGRVRRAKLYYLRDLRGKAARIEEKRQG